jgi:predicted site-specific integrase-resolvase
MRSRLLPAATGAAMRVASYVRVSTAEQNYQLQIRELHEFARHQGWEIGETYEDIISGAEPSRPGLNRLMGDARARKLDCVLVWKLDRFGRSLVDCLNNIQTHRTRFIAVTQGLDTDVQNPASPIPPSCPGCRGGVRTCLDPGAGPSGAVAIPTGFR